MRPVEPFPFPHMLPLTGAAFGVLPILELKERIKQWADDNEIEFDRVRRVCDSSNLSDPQAPPGCLIISSVVIRQDGSRSHVENETVYIK